MPAGPAARAKNRRQIAAAVAVQQIVDDGEAGVLDHMRGRDHLRRHGAVLEHPGDGVESGVGGRMQLAIKLRRIFADRKTAQHLAGMFPERGADFGEHDVTTLDLAIGRVLRRHRDMRIKHRGDAQIVDDVGATDPELGRET